MADRATREGAADGVRDVSAAEVRRWLRFWRLESMTLPADFLCRLCDAADERDALAQRVAVLEEALRPFAASAGYVDSAIDWRNTLAVADVCRARRALEGK